MTTRWLSGHSGFTFGSFDINHCLRCLFLIYNGEHRNEIREFYFQKNHGWKRTKEDELKDNKKMYGKNENKKTLRETFAGKTD